MLVTIECEGSVEQGFSVRLRIGEEGRSPSTEASGRLPPAPDLNDLYIIWQSAYRQLGDSFRIDAADNQVTNVSFRDHCTHTAQDLVDRFNQWLGGASLRTLREQLVSEVARKEPLRIILRTQDSLLRRLPWHTWDVLEKHCPRAEVVLSADEFKPVQARPSTSEQLRILVVLGHDEGINVAGDRAILAKLPQAQPVFLTEPTPQELHEHLWHPRGWDILFFAGHSASDTTASTGHIWINKTDRLTIDELRHALRTAIDRGLKLAIFNSCDGLGLAQRLADLHIPQMIVMREPVPDPVAQQFLKYFLQHFSRREPFHTAVRQARNQLQGLEQNYPCATWLPVICQNPAEMPLTWPQASANRLSVRIAAILGVFIALPIVWIFRCQLFLRSCPYSPTPRFSVGEQVLIPDQASYNKLSATKAFAAKDYDRAITDLETALKLKRNDPEALIYLNNAKAAKKANFYQIAVSVPIGSNLNVAQEILRGVAQAQDEVNRAGGIQGIPVQVMIANDNNDSDLVKQIATQFVQNSKILAVVGHNTSSASLTAAPIYQQGGLVMISPTSFADNLSGAGNFIFRTVSNTQVMANTLARYAVKSARKERVAICFDSQAPDNVSFKDSFVAGLLTNGGQLVPIPCDFSSPTFNPDEVVSQAIHNKADALLLAPHVDRIEQAIQVAKSNKQRLTLLGSPTLYTIKTLRSGQTEVNGLTLSVLWHPGSMSGQFFTKQAIQLWGGTVNWRTATAYDATQAIVTALKQNQTRKGIQQILRNPGFLANGAGEPIQFLPTGDRFAPPMLIQVKPGSSDGVKFTPLRN